MCSAYVPSVDDQQRIVFRECVFADARAADVLRDEVLQLRVLECQALLLLRDGHVVQEDLVELAVKVRQAVSGHDGGAIVVVPHGRLVSQRGTALSVLTDCCVAQIAVVGRRGVLVAPVSGGRCGRCCRHGTAHPVL